MHVGLVCANAKDEARFKLQAPPYKPPKTPKSNPKIGALLAIRPSSHMVSMVFSL